KFKKACDLPLTGTGVVDMVISDVGVFERGEDGTFTLTELAPEISVDDVKARTEAHFEVAASLV
ncbi:MAG: succinyl-CoA--3-ketoacid-CoA transferase, partial [Pseudomonadota bacterium]